MSFDRIDRVMQTGYLQLTPDMPIRRAVALLVDAGASAAPVVSDSGGLVGILTQKDCFLPALQASYYQEWKGMVADHMTVEVQALPDNTDLASAAKAFIEHSHRVFPVLDGDRLVGMVRRADILGALLRMG